MKIAIISSTVLPCLSPRSGGYGGLEPVAWMQADGLSRRGHEVLLVAPGGSVPPPGVELHQTTLGESEAQAYSGYWQRLSGYDVIIDGSWQKWAYILKAEGKLRAPVLGVCHAPIDTMFASPPPVAHPCLVGISDDQCAHISQHLGVAARRCYNAVDLDFYRSTGEPRGDRYLFLARFSRIKGAHVALDVARQARVGLDLVGDDRLTGEPDYVQRVMSQARAMLNARYVGPQTRAECVGWFSRNKVLLHLTAPGWREPFGLAPVEAQACGMPVIALDAGAMRETVVHGATGFVVGTAAEALELVKANAVASIKPEACRESAMRFSAKAMTDRLEELVAEAIECPW